MFSLSSPQGRIRAQWICDFKLLISINKLTNMEKKIQPGDQSWTIARIIPFLNPLQTLACVRKSSFEPTELSGKYKISAAF